LKSNLSKFSTLYSTMSRLLVEEPKYSWLLELGLKVDNPGVFCGAWTGNGQVGWYDTIRYDTIEEFNVDSKAE